jgi:hypothetical protein
MCSQNVEGIDESEDSDGRDEPIPGLLPLAGHAVTALSAESVSKMNIGRTGRDVEGDHEGGDRLAHDWFHALKNHEGAVHFQKQLPSVRRKFGNISAFRGRFQDGKVRLWSDMGPPPTASNGRYTSESDEPGLYLSVGKTEDDARKAVCCELRCPKPPPKHEHSKLMIHRYEIPGDALVIADFSTSALADTDYLNYVLRYAEEHVGRGGNDFSRTVGRLVAAAELDGGWLTAC